MSCLQLFSDCFSKSILTNAWVGSRPYTLLICCHSDSVVLLLSLNSAFNSSVCWSRQVHTQGCLIGPQPMFVFLYPFLFLFMFFLMWCTNSCPFPVQRANPGMRERTRKAQASSACTPSSRSLTGWDVYLWKNRRRRKHLFIGFIMVIKRCFLKDGASGKHIKLSAALLC